MRVGSEDDDDRGERKENKLLKEKTGAILMCEVGLCYFVLVRTWIHMFKIKV